MTYFMCDVECNGPIPGDYEMTCFGAVIVEPGLKRRFYGRLVPHYNISGPDGEAHIQRVPRPNWEGNPEVLKLREESRGAIVVSGEPIEVMKGFSNWVKLTAVDRPMFISDNNGFDYQFLTWYFYHYLGESPFGHTSTNLGSLYKGLVKTTFKNFKHLRKTPHTHHPVDDALGNAEALLHMKNEMGLRISLE